ncbi:Predicted membrane protein [Phaffia rhodozyma]|uniref:Predicted membrane protein n=1 Tax=Phaffia rhodozyma TaxID=264483 RepID=A0A0F7SLD1_PHARH|nr:Predicted membrane protein [Phaffia rhodozyma]
MNYTPPPLQHPIPRAPFNPPEPPRSSTEYSLPSQRTSTEGMSGEPQYMRFSSPPAQQYQQQQQQQQQTFGGIHQQQQQQKQQQNPAQTGYGQNAYGYQPSAGSSSFPPAGQMGSMSSQGQGQSRQSHSFQTASGSHVPWGMGMNDATAQMGMQFGKSAIGAGQDYVEKTFARHLPMSMLKHSFAVTNGYVIKKIGILLWPWRHGKFARSARLSQDGSTEGYLPPREDINAPDLYIPSMSLVTYILLSALYSGLDNRFHPEVLGVTASKAFGVVLLEFLVIKLGTYLLDVQGGGGEGVGGSLEMGMYGGYKFVGVILCLLVSIMNFGKLIWWSVFLYMVSANAFFLLRSLKYVVLPDPSSTQAPVSVSVRTSPTHAQRTTRVRFLIFIAIAQIFLMGLLVWV